MLAKSISLIFVKFDVFPMFSKHFETFWVDLKSFQLISARTRSPRGRVEDGSRGAMGSRCLPRTDYVGLFWGHDRIQQQTRNRHIYIYIYVHGSFSFVLDTAEVQKMGVTIG